MQLDTSFPPMETPTPPRVVGNFPFTMADSHVAGAAEKFDPLIVTQELATTPGRKLAPLTTPFAEIVGRPPATVTLRTRWEPFSAMYTLLDASTATSAGPLSWALAASPPSPAVPVLPFPANVEMTPAVFTLRIRWLPESV